MTHRLAPQQRKILILELVVLFVVVPTALCLKATHVHIALSLASVTLYGITRLRHCSWRHLWHGLPWALNQKKAALYRFACAVPLVFLLTYELAPSKMLFLPLQRPALWLLVMFLYPLLSVLPQEFLFRSYFFRRYQCLWSSQAGLIAVNALCFSFAHILFHNAIAPILCLVGGVLFAVSYNQHHSLKWSVLEHAAYGCLIFTAGIGFYFLADKMTPP